MFYYLYEVRNNINGKIYVGVHKTKVLDDGYMGSGKVIQRSIEKNGIENFTKTILEHFDSAEAMYAREKEVVSEEFLGRDDTYNLRCGGLGGFDHINKTTTSAQKAQYGRLGGIKATENLYLLSEDQKLARALPAILGSKRANTTFANPELRKLGNAPEARKKARISQMKTYKKNEHQKGATNSQFGSMWITNGESNLKIKSADELPEGWRRGRII